MTIAELNQNRANRFAQLVSVYRQLCGDDSNRETLTDILTDARHWAAQYQVSYLHASRAANLHYSQEIER